MRTKSDQQKWKCTIVRMAHGDNEEKVLFKMIQRIPTEIRRNCHYNSNVMH